MTTQHSKFCMDAGFISVVEVGQYFVTKDNGEQFYAMACREYHHNRKDGFRETRKLDPCWKLRPVACMANMESRLEFGL